MYAPRGFSGAELGDVEVIEHEGLFHLFHLTLPNHNVIQHAVSTDAIVWEPRPPALRTGNPGAFDDDQLWTMGVVRRGGRFYMLYTALCCADEGRVQRVGMAISDDLDEWRKVPNPVSEASLPHYRADREGAPWVSWRDPKPVILADGRAHAVVCARDPNGPALRQGVVGHIVSDDMRTWETLPPLFTSRRHVELECPQLFQFAGRLYLTAATLEERMQRYWFADDLEGPFRAPDDNRLLPFGHYAARVCTVADERWAFAFHDAGGGEGLRDRFLPAPVALVANEDGALHCRRTGGWDARATDAEEASAALLSPRFEAPRSRRDGAVFTSLEGAELYFRQWSGDVMISAELSVDAPVIGVVVSYADDGSGTVIELDRGAAEARVVRRSASEQHGHPWFRERILSVGRYRPAEQIRVEAIRAGGELIVSIDDRVVISTSHEPSEDNDGVGVLVESGELRLESLTVAEIRL